LLCFDSELKAQRINCINDFRIVDDLPNWAAQELEE